MVEKYSPLQPRNPAGQTGGGRWISVSDTPVSSHGDLAVDKGQSVVAQAAGWQQTLYAPKGTHNQGAGAQKGVAADCSGSVWAIYGQAGLPYRYTDSGNFAAATESGAIPFRKLDPGEPLQPGDVVLYSGHMSIYAEADPEIGPDTVWSAWKPGQRFGKFKMDFFHNQIGAFPYQDSGNPAGVALLAGCVRQNVA